MDAEYWKTRCERAEEALQRARSVAWITPARRSTLAVLADLKEGETLTCAQLAKVMGRPDASVMSTLIGLHSAGLVDRVMGRRGVGGEPSRWSLAHLVQVTEEAVATEADQ